MVEIKLPAVVNGTPSKLQKYHLLYQQLQAFKGSPLVDFRLENEYLPVLGEGDLDAQVMLIGEAPGRNEAETGRPFVGSAGKVLTGLLALAGLSREEVFITSVVQDRPPKNKTPSKTIVAQYKPFIFELISIIQPTFIITLGRIPLESLLRETSSKIGKVQMDSLHGTAINLLIMDQPITLLPSYHPAAVLYNPKLKQVLHQDFITFGQTVSASQ